MALVLPIEKREESIRKNPRVLIVYGKPKSGKTTAVSLLEDTLILDLDNGGTDHLSNVLTLKVIGLQAPKEEPAVKDARHAKEEFYLTEVIEAVKSSIKTTGSYPYKRVVIDTASALEDWCIPYATAKYMHTVQGKSFNRDSAGQVLPKAKWESVLTLPQGGGYQWLRDAFSEWVVLLAELAPDIILICHLKEKLINKAGKEMTSIDLALTGKISQITAANSDAIGYLYRNKSKTYLTFKSVDDTCGSRCAHLKGKEILIMEEDETGKIISNGWKDIYIE